MKGFCTEPSATMRSAKTLGPSQQRDRLSKLVPRIISIAEESKGSPELKGLGIAAAIAIRRKRDRLKARDDIDVAPWDQTINQVPEQTASFITNEDFQLLLKRDVEISYSMLPHREVVFCKRGGRLVPVARAKGRILMENPLKPTKKGRLVIESWARARSKSIEYNKHLPTSRARGQSRYLRNIDIESIEYKLFETAVGILSTDSRIFLYGVFDSPIGTLADGQPTHYVAMQCDRSRRKTGRGYFVEIHSYPYSQAETQRDLAGADSLEKLLHYAPLSTADYRRS